MSTSPRSETRTRVTRTAFALLGFGLVLVAVSSAQEYPQFGKVFQSHGPDGQPYLVVLCLQADQCFESAYQFCEGPYQPLDKKFIPGQGFRFVCQPQAKKRKQPQPPDPNKVTPKG